MDKSELKEILNKHKLYLDGDDGGERANLWGADLRGANLRGANLRYANLQNADLWNADLRNADLRNADLDFSAWPLWCGSVGVIVDARVAYQLAAHVCAVKCDDPDVQEMQKVLSKWASKSHRAEECDVVLDGEE